MPVLGPQNLGNNFYPKLIKIASELNMKPEDILAIMVSESGINPSAYEAKYHGGGLVGFMPSTLKNLGYKGEWSDFIKLNGEAQLDYVKKLIENNQKFNGGPFKSAAQYYVANFWPVALKLPGIKKENPDTIFIEENPETIKDKNGRKFSKKYFDIGYRIDPKTESNAYKENKLFHGSVPGAITYGDMINQINKNKNTNAYKQAIKMLQTSGYTPAANNFSTVNINSNNIENNFFSKLKKILNMFINISAVKNDNNFLISVGSSASDRCFAVEYAKILSAALEEYLDAKTNICIDPINIEIECKVAGDSKVLFDAIKQLSTSISEVFDENLKPIQPINTFALVMFNVKSDFKPLTPKLADLYHAKFTYKIAEKKKL